MKTSGVVILSFVVLLGFSILFFPAGRCESEGAETFYVGGSELGNYSFIQDAVNAAVDGDTIIVHEDIYNESVDIETDNLTEIEVVDVAVGQVVSIVPDALPGVTHSGTVETIDDFFVEKRGDVTYTARIRLEEIDPRLRWGMTVVVTFEE